MIKRITFKGIFIAIVLVMFFIKFDYIVNRNISSAISINKNINNVRKTTVIAVGDIMFHIPQIRSAYNGKTYDFRPVFEEIKPEIQSANIALGNFEAVILPNKKISGFPKFNVPVETLDSLKYAGFDVLNLANNHIMDFGECGLISTNNIIRKKGFISIGAGLKNNQKYAIINSNGIKIGILSYTFGTNSLRAEKDTLNYININSIKKDIILLRKISDFIIVYLHSGTEYVRNIEDSQRKLYRIIADMGADCILNSHPHVARSSEIYKTHGKDVFINYSLGNFLSNQNDMFTDIGLMVKLSIIKKGNITKLDENEIIPVYRLRYTNGNKKCYKVVLCSKIDSYSNKINSNLVSYVKYMNSKFSYPEVVEAINVSKNWRIKNGD